ncbi:hypothetical protein Tco_0719138 [Tanacetum coccineum]
MFCVFFFVTRVDENIIDEYYYEFFQVWFTYAVHEIHEYSSSCFLKEANLIRCAAATGAAPGFRQPFRYRKSGWPLVLAVLGQMAHLVASITLNSTRSDGVAAVAAYALTASCLRLCCGGPSSVLCYLIPLDLWANVNVLPLKFVLRGGVPVGLVFLLGLLVSAIVAACASRAVVTLSTTSFLMAA